MVEVDACAPADDGLDVAVLAVDVDVAAGVALVFGDLVLRDGADLLLVVFAEGVGGRDGDGALVADLLAQDVLLDVREDVGLSQDDGAGPPVLLLGVDAVLLRDRLVRRVDQLAAVDGAGGVGEL